jgi:hypothetical protein
VPPPGLRAALAQLRAQCSGSLNAERRCPSRKPGIPGPVSPRKHKALVQGAYAAGSLMVKQRVWTKFFSSSNRPLEAMRTLSVEPSLHRSLAL